MILNKELKKMMGLVKIYLTIVQLIIYYQKSKQTQAENKLRQNVMD